MESSNEMESSISKQKQKEPVRLKLQQLEDEQPQKEEQQQQQKVGFAEAISEPPFAPFPTKATLSAASSSSSLLASSTRATADSSPASLSPVISPATSPTSSGNISPAIWAAGARSVWDITPPNDANIFVLRNIQKAAPIRPDAEPYVAVIGVGYVGEHLVNVFSERFYVLGYDISNIRAMELAGKFHSNQMVKITSDPMQLLSATHFLIAVPTLLRPDKTVDSSYLREALATVKIYARRGATVVVESSVAVGMTRELLGPIAQKKNFFAGMSPERVDPGRVSPPPHAIPKVVSGLDDLCPGSLNAITRLYSGVFQRVVPVTSPEVAEMMKLYENCQRMVAIAYANEMADACLKHGIDPFEVSSVAATKPFGFLPIKPGLGVGGHCIPVNPHYLFSNCKFPLLKAATEKMQARPRDIAERTINRLLANLELNGSSSTATLPTPRVLIVGIGFKAGQSHLVNSPSLELAQHLVVSRKVSVTWADPLVAQRDVPNIPRLDTELDWNAPTLETCFDEIIVACRPQGLDFGILKDLMGVEVQMWCD